MKCRTKPPTIPPQPRRQAGKQPHAMCDDYCVGCFYASVMPSPTMEPEIGCSYIDYQKKRRGCPAGTGCDKRLLMHRTSILAHESRVKGRVMT